MNGVSGVLSSALPYPALLSFPFLYAWTALTQSCPACVDQCYNVIHSGRPQFLANLGFVVITVDYRGSYGFGLDHHDAVFGSTEGTGVGVADLQDCVRVAAHVRR